MTLIEEVETCGDEDQAMAMCVAMLKSADTTEGSAAILLAAATLLAKRSPLPDENGKLSRLNGQFFELCLLVRSELAAAQDEVAEQVKVVRLPVSLRVIAGGRNDI